MEFRANKAIYVQIADQFNSQILKGVWKADEKVPSVRQLAVELEVNPNTVMRTYSMLQKQGIIYNKRGIGYFVSPQAKTILLDQMKKQFIDNELPDFFERINLLKLSIKDIEKYYEKWNQNNSKD